MIKNNINLNIYCLYLSQKKKTVIYLWAAFMNFKLYNNNNQDKFTYMHKKLTDAKVLLRHDWSVFSLSLRIPFMHLVENFNLWPLNFIKIVLKMFLDKYSISYSYMKANIFNGNAPLNKIKQLQFNLHKKIIEANQSK